MIDWLPFCVPRSGPLWKAGYPFGMLLPFKGEIKHSAEGYWPGIYANLDGPRRGSWHFTVGYDRIEQHYPLAMKCWHADDTGDDGEIRANLELWGTEHLGMAGQPLSDYQIDATTRLSRALMREAGYTSAGRTVVPGVFYEGEHNEVADNPTSCPSGRIDWARIMPALGSDMFVRLNGRAAWWDNRQFPAGASANINLAVDFPGLPQTALAVELDIRIEQAGTGELAMLDGDATSFADGLNRYKPQAIVKLIPKDGKVWFKVLGAPVTFKNVGIVGYWN